ncbi:MAG: DUF1559 domain-containing protein [Planctomycetes bacterium]|nr:DUF1559 domain-containing protein [Planctomycetota bacterium]
MLKFQAQREGQLPGFDSTGYNREWGEKRKEGLSWRVYLLPHLGHQKLYDQFKHGEPWDGPNNKKLVAKMPDVYKSHGVDEPGKTSIHVFISAPGKRLPYAQNPPFGRKFRNYFIGPKVRDITDGLRNTLMMVEAGPDKADFWTKPNGLPFDPDKHPLVALGNIEKEGFLVLFFDGYVGRIKKSISADQMKILIQCADGIDVGQIPGINRTN